MRTKRAHKITMLFWRRLLRMSGRKGGKSGDNITEIILPFIFELISRVAINRD